MNKLEPMMRKFFWNPNFQYRGKAFHVGRLHVPFATLPVDNGERSLESATSVTVRGRWRRAHLVSTDKSRRGRAGSASSRACSKPQCDVTLSTRAAPCFGPALRKRRSARPLCAPQARTVHTRQRATGARTLPACLPCVVVLCHQRHCRATLQCCPLRDRA